VIIYFNDFFVYCLFNNLLVVANYTR